MAADRGKLPPDAFGDIPDPLLGAPLPRPMPMQPPSTQSATRSELRRRRLALLVSALVWPAVVLVWYEGGWRGRGLDFVAAQFVLWTALLGVAAWLALSPGTRGVGRPVRWLRATAIGAPLAFVLLGLLWLPPHGKPAIGALGPPDMLEGCFQIGLTVAVPTLLLAVWAMRRAFPAGAAWRGAALGAACGLGAVIVLLLLCGSPFGGHIALAHGLPLVIATVIGAWGGARVGRV